MTNNALKRARSGNNERWITEHIDKTSNRTKSQNGVKSSRRSSASRVATDVFISTEIGQVIKINKSNGQYELLQLDFGQPGSANVQADAVKKEADEGKNNYDNSDLNNNDECQVLHGSTIKQSVVEGPFERAKRQSEHSTPPSTKQEAN